MAEIIDLFSHDVIAKRIVSVFSEYETNNSFVIAINGAWGTGKTHLLNEVMSELNDENYIKVNFNAWRYTEKEDIRRALLISIIDGCRHFIEDDSKKRFLGWNDEDKKLIERIFDETERSLYTAFVREIPGEISINTGNLLKTGASMALKFVPWGNFGNEFIQRILAKKGDDKVFEACIEKEDIEELWGIFTRSSIKKNIERVVGVEQFRKTFEALLTAILKGKNEGVTKKENLCEHNKNIKLIVAIDDLDRCLPEDALNILEAIKLFIDYPNTYFVIAMDGSIIQKALNIRYDKHQSVIIRAKDYYEKMIDLSFNMPSLVKEKLLLYIHNLSVENLDYSNAFELLFIALNTNLRAWQRYIYRAEFNKVILENIAGKGFFDDELILNAYLKLQGFSYQWPDLYRMICDMNSYLVVEKSLHEIANYKNKKLDDILMDLEELGISTDIRKTIDDKKILDYILMDPKLETIEKNALNVLFTFDKLSLQE